MLAQRVLAQDGIDFLRSTSDVSGMPYAKLTMKNPNALSESSSSPLPFFFERWPHVERLHRLLMCPSGAATPVEDVADRLARRGKTAKLHAQEIVHHNIRAVALHDFLQEVLLYHDLAGTAKLIVSLFKQWRPALPSPFLVLHFQSEG